MNLTKTVYLAICVLGLIWHCYHIGEPYFKYRVITIISIDWPEIEYSKSINFGFIKKIVDPNTTVQYQWDITPSIEDLRPIEYYCGYLNNTHRLPCAELIIKKYLYDKRPFYSLCPPSGGNNFMTRKNYLYNRSSFLLYVTLIKPNTSFHYPAIGAFLSDFRESPIAILQRQIPYLSYKANTVYTFEYSHLNIIKMKSPFTDQCTDYRSNLDCHSRATCLTQCIDKLTRKNFNEVTSASLVMDPINLKFFNPEADYNQDKIPEYNKFLSDCEIRYQNPDCEINTILSSVRHITVYNDNFKNMIGFISELSGNPSTIIKSDQLIPFIDFITFILGSLGTWLGFSFLGTVPSLLNSFKNKNQVADNDQNQDNNLAEDKSNLNDKIKLMNARIKYLKTTCDLLREQLIETKEEIKKMKTSPMRKTC